MPASWAKLVLAVVLLATVSPTIEAQPRAQEPKPPLPYDVQDAKVRGPGGQVLAGTLTLPRKKPARAAVVLLTGSGPQDRDESVAGHRPFLVLADHLTRHDIAVLRCDDRGVGGSSGDFAAATTADFVQDAMDCLEFMKTHPRVAGIQLGLIGHSAGAQIGARVAAVRDDVGFLVLLGALGVPLEQGFVQQHRDVARARGMDERQIASLATALEAFCELARQDVQGETLRDAVSGIVTRWYDTLPEAERERSRTRSEMIAAYTRENVALIESPTFREGIRSDPRALYRQVRCPVLILAGEHDLQANPTLHVPAIERALRSGGNQAVEASVFPGLNHLFQTSSSGLPEEYDTIEETFSPAALSRISTWILGVSKMR